ncbi:MAG: hypothetical protein JW833_15530 [Prolixibacteraceae bacterium]|nr:hypothetical protein [Prolixibacteraceae bacterium]
MRKLILLFLIILLCYSCDKYPFPGSKILEDVDFQLIGNDQQVKAGDYFPDSVGVIIDMESVIIEGEKEFRMEIEVTEGEGTVDQQIVYSNRNGRMLTRWKTGKNSNEQKLKAKIYDSQNRFLTETRISGISYFSGGWNLISSGLLTKIDDLIIDTMNHRSVMVANGNMYKNGEDFFHWELINSSFSGSVICLEVDSKGILYAGAGQGRLYKSSDWGESWSQCTKPIPENNGDYQLSVSSDDYFWAYRQSFGIWCSKDRGISWQRDTVGLAYSSIMGGVYRLNDGSHICVAQSQMQIFRTWDDGLTWEQMNSPEGVRSCYVTNYSEIVILAERNGYTIFKSSDFGVTYKTIRSVTPSHLIFPIGNNFGMLENQYYLYIPGSHVYKTSDFETFESLLIADDQRYLYIDHRGTLFVCGNSDQPVYILPN